MSETLKEKDSCRYTRSPAEGVVMISVRPSGAKLSNLSEDFLNNTDYPKSMQNDQTRPSEQVSRRPQTSKTAETDHLVHMVLQ